MKRGENLVRGGYIGNGLAVIVAILGSQINVLAVVAAFPDGATVGSSANIVGYQSLAVGLDVQAAGMQSIALGNYSFVNSSSYYSGVFGGHSTITNGMKTFAFGSGNFATNQSKGFLAGSENNMWSPSTDPGVSNILLGTGNIINSLQDSAVSVSDTVLIGAENTSDEAQAWVLGMRNIGQANTVTLGTFNQPVSNASLIVGNGENGATRSNGLVVLRNGTVQIPSGNLQLGSESALTATGATTLISSHLSTNGYLKRASGTGAAVSNGAVMAVGNNAVASASGSMAMGYQVTASGDNSTALGANTEATGSTSTVMGFGNIASANVSTAIGASNIANGNVSTAMGFGNTASGNVATVMGSSNTASGAYTTAMGCSNTAQAMSSTVLGQYNVIQGSPATWVPTDDLFVIGNGTSEENRSNALMVKKNGDMMVNGNTALEGNANVAGDTTLQGNATIQGDTVLEGKVTLAQPQGDISMGIYN